MGRATIERLRNEMRALYERLGKEPTATRAMWMKAAADYYVALHPDEARWRSAGVADGIPSIDDIRDRAEVADRAHKAIPRTGRIDPDPKRRDVWAAQVGWAEEMVGTVLTRGFRAAMAALKTGDQSGLEYGVRFLEADPWCFRSGYAKATLIPSVAHAELEASMRERLTRVVLAVVDDPRRRREIGEYGKLARAVATPELEAQLEQRLAASDPQVRFNAGAVLERLPRPQTPTPLPSSP